MLRGKAEIGRTGCDRRRNIGAFALLDINADIGMLAQECRQRPRQMLRQAGCVGKQKHAGSDAGGIGREIAPHCFDVMHDDAGVIEQAFARRSQFDAAAATLQECRAKSSFQAFDPRTRGGQRQMRARRAAGDTARIGNGDE